MDAAALVAESRTLRTQTVRRFAGTPDAELASPALWRGAPHELRFSIGWLAEGDDAAANRITDTLLRLGRPLSVAQSAMISAAAERGRLLGSLIGLNDALFDRAPAADEWSVRQVLGHVIATDWRYAIAVRYAIERARTTGSGPLRPPAAALPATTEPAYATGTPLEVAVRLLETSDSVSQELGSIPSALLSAPTNWVHWDLDIRFRLHRFAAHVREHAIQVRKSLGLLGVRQTEAQMILADAATARLALETLVLTIPRWLFDTKPPGGRPSIATIATDVLADERSLTAR